MDITVDRKLKRGGKNYLQLCSVNADSDPKLIEFLFNYKGELYRFANNENTRKLVNLSKGVFKRIQAQGLSHEEIKQSFFNCLILAVNQPNMEELIDIIRSGISDNDDFFQFRKEVMGQLLSDEDPTFMEVENLLSGVYSYNLFLFWINDMFLNENVCSVKFIEINSPTLLLPHTVTLDLKNFIICLKPLEVNDKLSFEELNQKKIFSIKSLFSFFIQQWENDYFVVYTNASSTYQ